MPSIGISEILIISLVALLVIKPRDLPAMARKAGRLLRLFKDYRTTFMNEITSLVNPEDSLREGDGKGREEGKGESEDGTETS